MHFLRSIALRLTVIAVPFFLTISSSISQTVGYVSGAPAGSPEDSVATALISKLGYRVKMVSVGTPDLSGIDFLWMHCVDSISYEVVRPVLGALKKLYASHAEMPRLLCTQYASLAPHDIGLESAIPEKRSLAVHDDWAFDERGFQSMRGHPLFDALHGGAFVWDSNCDHTLTQIGFFGDKWPREGRVVGVDKSYVTVHASARLLLEYGAEKPVCIAVGACVYLSHPNKLHANLETLIGNCFARLSGAGTSTTPTWWVRSSLHPSKYEERTEPLVAASSALRKAARETDLVLQRDSASDNAFDVVGRRVMAFGREQGGLDEVWVHPFRIAKRLQVSIVRKDTLTPLSKFPCRVEVRPESFTRIYRIDKFTLREVIVASHNRPGVLITYSYSGTKPLRVVMSASADLRLMWPYDEKALGSLFYAYDEGLRAFRVRDTTGAFQCLYGADAGPISTIVGQYSGITRRNGSFIGIAANDNIVSFAAEYELDGKKNKLALALAGSDQGGEEPEQCYRVMLTSPVAEIDSVVAHYDRLLSESAMIESPDREFNDLYKWALVGTDRFVAETPGVGTALLAGYGSTARGWNGGHDNNGRPGYAWYFGRDAEWSCMALSEYGDFENMRRQIELLAGYQDAHGRILHELSTSGAVHYDAADATPLFVILAAQYARASGDFNFLNSMWPSIEKALRFLYSTDTDGDMLIENTNVGHGWVEGGALFGAHTECYLAGLWLQSLKDAAMMAHLLQKKNLFRDFAEDAEVVGTKFDQFWNPDTRYLNHGLRKDGTFDTEQTVMASVPMLFNLVSSEKAELMLEQLASDRFSTDWGVRIIGTNSKLFDPTGYHSGSVWPLFTGWTASAEYSYGHSSQGFSHVWSSMQIKKNWSLGFVEEVMHGLVNRPMGVCPHQCWSEAGIIYPVLAGMVGWKPEATRMAAVFEPRFPLHWDTVSVVNLRCGQSVYRLSMKRSLTKTTYRVRLVSGPPLEVMLLPEIQAGMKVTDFRINGRTLPPGQTMERGLYQMMVPAIIRKEAAYVISHTGGIGVVPEQPHPAVGDSLPGYRFVGGTWSEEVYRATFEGPQGTKHIFRVNIFDKRPLSVEDGVLGDADEKGIADVEVQFNPSDRAYSSRTVVFKYR